MFFFSNPPIFNLQILKKILDLTDENNLISDFCIFPMGKIKQECNAIIHGTIVSHDQIASRKRVAACVEKIRRIKAEIESRSKDVNKSRKADLIHRIKIAQVAAKKRKK